MSTLGLKITVGGWATCVVACLLAVPVGAGEATAPKPASAWRVVDPDEDCEVAFKGSVITIRVPGTAHDLSAELDRRNAPRVVSEIAGDFDAQVRVSGDFGPGSTTTVPSRRPYHGGGLLLVQDRDTYVRLERSAVRLDDRVRHYLNFELRRGDTLAVSLNTISIPDDDTYLRLERRRNRVIGSTSPDGDHWTSYDPIEADLGETLEIGLLAVSSSNVPLAVRFDDIAISAGK